MSLAWAHQNCSCFKTGFSIFLTSLAPGIHELILQYEDLWEIDNDNHQMIRSGPLVFSLHLQANERLVIEHAPLLNLSQAQAFATSPKVILASEFQRSKASHLKKENPLTFNEASEVKKMINRDRNIGL